MKAPFLKSRFFKLSQPKSFRYMPRHFDEEKERLENMKKYGRSNISFHFKMRKQQQSKSSVRLILILSVLLYLSWYFLSDILR